MSIDDRQFAVLADAVRAVRLSGGSTDLSQTAIASVQTALADSRRGPWADAVAGNFASTIAALRARERTLPSMVGSESTYLDFSKLSGPQFSIAGMLKAAGVAARLDEIITAISPQHAALSAMVQQKHSLTDRMGEQVRQILSSQNSVGNLFLNIDYFPTLANMLSSVARYGQTQVELGAFTVRPDAGGSILRGYTSSAGNRFDSYLDGLPRRPAARRAAVAQYGGDVQVGLLTLESLTAPNLEQDARAELTDHLDVEVLQPWERGPAEARVELFGFLRDLDPGLPGWLEAAWDNIVRDGPKAASLIANCTVELIDQSLRIAAPTEDVLAWLSTIPARQGHLHEGRPTRRARVMFVMRHRSQRDARLAASQIDALAKLLGSIVDEMQGYKHAEAASMAIVRGWVMATEGALSQLFLHS